MAIVRDAAKNLVRSGKPDVAGGLLVEEMEGNNGRFPTIRVLEERASRHLIPAVANHICCTGQRHTGLKGLFLHPAWEHAASGERLHTHA